MAKPEFWTIVETKMFSDGTAASTAVNKMDYPHAQNVYFSSLATGATNGVPYHATFLISSKSGVKMFNIYDRRADDETEAPQT